MKQSWKDIPTWNGIYQVSNCGRYKRIYKNGRERIITNYIQPNGYVQLRLFDKKRKEYPYMHIVVYETFKRKLKKGEQVHHLNRNRSQNNIQNLIALSIKDHHDLHYEDENFGMKGKHHSEQTKQKLRSWERTIDYRKKLSESAKHRKNKQLGK